MASRSIEIAVISATLIAVQMLVTAEPAVATDQTEPAVTSDREGELIVIAEASGASDPDDAAAPRPSLVVGEPFTVDAEPRALYQPPRRGAPERERVGTGITRGATAQPTPLALAPDHVGLTVSASPSLFWHIDAVPAEGVALIFTVTDDTSVTPLAEVGVDATSEAGIQRLRLADHGIELEPEVEYMWSIALVTDAQNRSEDVVSTGFIRRVARPKALATGSQGGVDFAQAGIWYDALEALSDDVDEHPDDRKARFLRSALLRQVKLDAAVE
jgi:hypothetical protein